MSKVFVTADTHFGQVRTLELSRRPFSNVTIMDVTMITNWNNTVGPDDVVVHLGDFGLTNRWYLVDGQTLLQDLNGRAIYFVPGNYDTPEVLDVLRQDPRVVITEPNTTLNFVLMHADMLPHGITTQAIKLVHEPERADDPMAFYLYGHVHQLSLVKRNGLNVGMDCHGFKPIDLDIVKFYYDAITKHYDNNVFMPYLGGQP